LINIHMFYLRTHQCIHSVYIFVFSEVCCSVLQCVAVCCSVLQCVSCRVYLEDLGILLLRCSVLHCVAVCCRVLQRAAVRCSVFFTCLYEGLAYFPSLLQCVLSLCVAVCCSVLQRVAVCFATYLYEELLYYASRFTDKKLYSRVGKRVRTAGDDIKLSS